MEIVKSGVSAFPARRCAHCVRGRCVLAMRRDPESHEAWRCRVVSDWDRAVGEGQARADAFGLSPEAEERLCIRAVERVPGPEACEGFSPGPDPFLGCNNLWQDTCLLRPPRCPGPCPDFREGKAPGK